MNANDMILLAGVLLPADTNHRQTRQCFNPATVTGNGARNRFDGLPTDTNIPDDAWRNAEYLRGREFRQPSLQRRDILVTHTYYGDADPTAG